MGSRPSRPDLPTPDLSPDEAARRLGHLLQLAYSGELGAAHAYIGHARSVKDPEEKKAIRKIELQEWDHRERDGRMLAAMGLAPDPDLERRALKIGKALSLLCHLGGWFWPMYGAGRLERRNIVEYEDAARFALLAGRREFVEDCLHMAEVEWDHERYFWEKAASHFLWRFSPKWPPPPPRESIRRSFQEPIAADRRA